MEAASLEVEDDVFFADLSKQISLLIMDDDEESLLHCPSVNLQAIRPASQATLFNYDHQTLRPEMSKGTGVFIPRSSQSNSRRTHSKQSRFSGNYKMQRPADNHRSRELMVPHFKYNNSNNNYYNSYIHVDPSCDSFNLPRRF